MPTGRRINPQKYSWTSWNSKHTFDSPSRYSQEILIFASADKCFVFYFGNMIRYAKEVITALLFRACLRLRRGYLCQQCADFNESKTLNLFFSASFFLYRHLRLKHRVHMYDLHYDAMLCTPSYVTVKRLLSFVVIVAALMRPMLAWKCRS